MSLDDSSIPLEARRLVEGFAGEWVANGTMVVDGRPSAINGRWRFTRAMDGWGVYGALKTEIEGFGAIEEIDVAAFNAATGKVHLTGMNRFAVRDHVGAWLDATTLKLVYRGREGGKDVSEEVTIDLSTPGVQRGVVVERWDGVVAITTELTLTRVG
jgi:hypothetical protein